VSLHHTVDGYPVQGYRIYKSKNGEDFKLLGDTDPMDRSYGLEREFDWKRTEYFYAVAYNQFHESEPSIITNSTRAFWQEPTPPQNVKIKNTDEGVLITWEPPALDGGYPISGYKVLGSTDKEEWTQIAYVPKGDRSYLITNASDDGYDHYQVAADNYWGWTNSEIYDEGPEEDPGDFIIYIMIIVIIMVITIVIIIVGQLVFSGPGGEVQEGPVMMVDIKDKKTAEKGKDIGSMEDLEKRYLKGEISEGSFKLLKEEMTGSEK
jgi:hypothetical protein